MTERFPTEARATASAFCYHLGTIFGGIVPPLITYFAVNHISGSRSRCWWAALSAA